MLFTGHYATPLVVFFINFFYQCWFLSQLIYHQLHSSCFSTSSLILQLALTRFTLRNIYPFYTFSPTHHFHFDFSLLAFLPVRSLYCYRKSFRSERAFFGACNTTTCFYQNFPGSWQFNLEGSTASGGLPSPTVCVKHTVIHKPDVQ